MRLSESRQSPQPNLLLPNLPLPNLPIAGWWAIGLLFALVLLTYAPAMMAGFIWDDDQYVTDNIHLQTAGGLWRIWFEPGATPQYYPLVFSTFWVECRLWGLNPAGFHVVNILLHALNAVLLFRALSTLQVPGAFFAAALFAVAPVHVESVAWVSERKNVLSGMFYLLAFLAYWRFVCRGEDGDASHSARRWQDYVLSLVLFGCALMSKSVTCSLPAAILLVLWWKKGRLTFRTVIAVLPMFAIGIAAGVHTILMEKHHVGAQGLDWEWSLLERCLIATRILWFYAVKLVWPQPLIFIYPKWQIDTSAWWQYAFGVSFVGMVVWLWLARNRLGRGPLVAVLFFAGTLFPALGFIDVYPMRFSFVADHFQYLASVGLISLMAAAAATAAAKLRLTNTWSLLFVSVVLLAFGRMSLVRCFDYRNAETLWAATLAKNPDCWMANHNLASIRFQQQRFNEALTLFQNALRHEANDEPSDEERADFHYCLGATLQSLGKPDEATAHFHKAVESFRLLAASETPPSTVTHNNLGILYGILQQHEDSMRHFQLALEIDPTDPEVNQNLGELYYRLKRFEESAACFRQVLEIEPNNAWAHYNLGTVALTVGRRREATDHLREALRIAPDFAAARVVLQQALAEPSPGSE